MYELKSAILSMLQPINRSEMAHVDGGVDFIGPPIVEDEINLEFKMPLLPPQPVTDFSG